MNNTCYKDYTKQSVHDSIQAKAENWRSTLEAEQELQEPALNKTRYLISQYKVW